MKSVANRNLQGVPLDSDGAASYNRCAFTLKCARIY